MDFRELKQYCSLKEEITDIKNRIKEIETEINGYPKDFAAPERLALEHAKCERLLLERKRLCARELARLERIISGCEDSYIRRILRFKFCDGLSWTAVAHRLGGTTGDACRMLAKRYLKSKK